MRILHTADVHLSDANPHTFEALEVVLAEASARSVDLLTIGGDLFDSPTAATRLKKDVRELFTGNDFDIVAIPGNHDADILERDFDLGPDLTVLHNAPYERYSVGEVAVIGVPYRNTMTSELFTALQDAASDAVVRILLLHCTLDIGFSNDAIGNEEKKRYFPTDPATMGELDYNLVLAGHFHSRFQQVALPNGGDFVYPGSPTSHSTSEKGPRKAVLVDTETLAIDPVPLDTFYHDSFLRQVTPASQEDAVTKLDQWTADRADDDCAVEITVSGYVDADEQTYGDRLRTAAEPFNLTNNVDGISHVLKSDLYQRVTAELDEETASAYEAATVAGAEEHVMNALAGLIDIGEVRK